MKRLFWGAALFLFFAALGIGFTFPLVKHIHRGMPYTHAALDHDRLVQLAPGDYLQLFYCLWLFKDAVAGQTPLFRDPYQFNVPGIGTQEDFNHQFVPLSALYALPAFLTGDTAGYNLLLLMTFPLSGLGFYLLARLWLDCRWAALTGGAVYAVFPYRIAHLMGGQPGAFCHFFLPWILYFLILGLKRRRWLWGALAGLTYLCMGLDEFHLAYYLPLFTGLFLVFPLMRFSFDPGSLTLDLGNWTRDRTILGHPGLRGSYAVMTALGAVCGLFLAWWFMRRWPVAGVWALVPAGVVGLMCLWILYSWFLHRISGLERVDALKDDVLSYLPVLLFLIYPVQFTTDLPGLGSRLIGIVALFSMLIKLYRIFRLRHGMMERLGMKIRFARDRAVVVAAMAVPAFVLAGWMYYEKMTRFDRSPVGEGRPFGMIRLYSPRPEDLWNKIQFDGDRLIYPGVFALGLSLCGLLAFMRGAKGRYSMVDRSVYAVLSVLFFLTYWLSFGPNLDSILPLYSFFYENVPQFNYVRSPTRILYVSFLFLALLSAFGLRALFDRIGKKSLLIGVLAVAGVLADYFPATTAGISLVPQESRVYSRIASVAPEARMLALPIWPGESAWSSLYQFYASRYRLRMANGYRPTVSLGYIEEVFRVFEPVNSGEITETIWRKLKAWDIRFIVFHEDAFPAKVSAFPPHGTMQRLMQSPFVRLALRDGPVSLFEVLEDPDIKAPAAAVSASPVSFVAEAEHFIPRKGAQISDPDASEGTAVYLHSQEEKGWWLMARSRPCPSGSYQSLFRLKTHGARSDADAVTLEIRDGRDERVLASKTLEGADLDAGDYTEHELRFQVRDFAHIQPRLWGRGGAGVTFDWCLTGFLSVQSPFEAEQLIHSGAILEDPEAGANEAVRADSGTPRRTLVYGPYRLYEPGRYRVMYRLKLDRAEGTPLNEHVATVLVTAQYGKKILAKSVIRARDFRTPGGYQSFALHFSLEHPLILEFPVRFEGRSGIIVDSIAVVRK